MTQNNNRRTNNYITYGGETKSLSQWSRKLGLSRQALHKRVNSGWSIDRIFQTPKKSAYKVLLQSLLDDVMKGKYGTKNRVSLIMRLEELINF